MSVILNQKVEEEYLALVRAFPLVSIRDEAHLAQALAVIDGLTEKPSRSAAEEEYLSALTDLVEIYEAVHVAIPPITGVGALRYLMAENDLSQADLVPIFGTPSVISEVLSGKRGLALAHIKKLAARFGVPTDVFIQ